MNLRAVALWAAVALLLVSGCVKNAVTVAPVDLVVGNVAAQRGIVVERASSDPAHVKWAAKDDVDVEWRGRWYPATVLEQRGGSHYLVHYDGYSEEWDEVVTAERIRLRRLDETREPNEPALVEPDP